MAISFHCCTSEDLEKLIAIGIETYSDTFSAMNTPENMQAYLETAFNRKKIAGELNNPESSFFFLLVDDHLAGYLKTNTGQAQTDLREADGLEIERIYIRKPFQRHGYGKLLIEKGIEAGHQKHKSYVWLGVWEKNEAAIAFYQRMGFVSISTHDFYMGDDRQTDLIMKKTI